MLAMPGAHLVGFAHRPQQQAPNLSTDLALSRAVSRLVQLAPELHHPSVKLTKELARWVDHLAHGSIIPDDHAGLTSQPDPYGGANSDEHGGANPS